MNVVDLVRYWGAWRPDHPALIFGDLVQSWGEMDARSDALARGLAAQGVGHGDRVGALMMNRPELTHLALATLKLGAICVPLNFRLTPTEMTPLLLDADCKVVVVDGALTHLVEPAAQQLPFTTFALDSTDVRPYADLVVEVGPVPSVPVADDDGAFICYTSGTTGVQKGALLTHRGVLYPGQTKLLAEGLSWRDRMLVAIPLVYTGGMVSCFIQVVTCGGGTLVLEADFDPDRYLATIERHRVTALSTVPVIWERLANSAEFTTHDISSLVSAVVGGAPVRLDLLEAFRERDIDLIQAYGLTEAGGLTALIRREDAINHIGFAGKPLIGTQIRIGDEQGHTVPTGEVGEILVKGPHVMREYWRKPEATAETIVDGWLHSGDLGLQDADGYLKVVDRTKDMLISGGINVYPAEIEKALAGIDGVIDLAVIGVPDARWGETPMVVIHATRDADGIVADIEAIGRRDLAGFKRPKYAVLSTDPLPRTFSGKLAKPVLRQQFSEAPADAIPLFQSS